MPPQDHVLGTPALARAFHWLVSSDAFGSYKFRKDSRFTPAALVKLVLLWSWGEQAALTERFTCAQEIIADPSDSQHQSITYQAFVKLLKRHSTSLLYALITSLQARLRESLPDSYRVAGFIVFAVDGTRVATPRTAANQAAFEPTKKCRRSKKKRRTPGMPQIWLTTLWHVGTGLPWGWRSGPSNSSERHHFQELLTWLPESSLITADAGFISYDLCQALGEAGHDLLLRVGGNVKLLKKLGYARESNDRVYLWPDRAAKRQQQPIVLRLVVAHDGKHPVYLVTSVLTKQQLSDPQVIDLYRRRWGIEVFYRSFKRTFARQKLRSASPENALLELDWSLVALWAACLYAKLQQGTQLARTSVAGVLRGIRRATRDATVCLVDELAKALVNTCRRTNKASRDYPAQKTDPPSKKPPTITKATRELVDTAKLLQGFTA